MKSKHLFIIFILLLCLFSCDLFNPTGTGTLIFKGVSELPDLAKIAISDEIVTDVDGNEYGTIIVGGQVWMAENLKVTHYRNGDTLKYAPDSIAWTEGTAGEYCFYDNDSSYIDTFGYLYNWYVVNDGRGLAPEGWHVARDEDWKHLEKALGMSSAEADTIGWRGTNQGSKLKSTYRWNANGNGTDDVNFTALPGGYISNGAFDHLGIDASFWTSDEVSEYNTGIYRDMYSDRNTIRRYSCDKNLGMSIRCVKDIEDDGPGSTMEMTGMAFNIYEMWISQSLVQDGISDIFEWHLLGEDQGLILMRDVEMMADSLPSGEYKSLKIVFRNQAVRHGRSISDTSLTMGFETGISTDMVDSSFFIDYFSSGGSFYYDDGAFVLMAAGENMPSFNINAGRTTYIYWKGGGPETKWSDITFDWHDYDGNGLWTPGIDILNNFEEPNNIPMWTFMVVEE